MVNTRANGQGSKENKNTNTQMNKLRDILQTSMGVMASQQQLLQQDLQSSQLQQAKDQYSSGGENQH